MLTSRAGPLSAKGPAIPAIRRIAKGFAAALGIGLLAGAGTVGYFGMQTARTIFGLLTENKELHAALANLTATRQIGYAKVLSQQTTTTGTQTRLLFVVTDPADQTKRLLEREYAIEGDVVHFDALVVKFSPDLVMDGRERAMFIWHRVYGEHTAPTQGFPIENPGQPPSAYRDLLAKLDLPDRELFWTEIWGLANSPGRLAEAGVQAIYGSGVYSQMRPGLIYIFNLDADGTFYRETAPDL